MTGVAGPPEQKTKKRSGSAGAAPAAPAAKKQKRVPVFERAKATPANEKEKKKEKEQRTSLNSSTSSSSPGGKEDGEGEDDADMLIVLAVEESKKHSTSHKKKSSARRREAEVQASPSTVSYAACADALSTIKINAPRGLAFASKDVLNIADAETHTISRHLPTASRDKTQMVYRRGDSNVCTQQLKRPATCAFGLGLRAEGKPPSFDLYIADNGNRRVVRLSSATPSFRRCGSVSFHSSFGSPGAGEGQFEGPGGIAVSSASGEVFVCDSGNKRVQVFSAEGVFRRQFGVGLLSAPWGIAICTAAGEVFVSDVQRNCIFVFALSDCRLLRQWGAQGSGPGMLSGPCGLALCRTSNDIFVAEYGNHRVSVFNRLDGAHLWSFGREGSEPGCFDGPFEIALSYDGRRLYVSVRCMAGCMCRACGSGCVNCVSQCLHCSRYLRTVLFFAHAHVYKSHSMLTQCMVRRPVPCVSCLCVFFFSRLSLSLFVRMWRTRESRRSRSCADSPSPLSPFPPPQTDAKAAFTFASAASQPPKPPLPLPLLPALWPPP